MRLLLIIFFLIIHGANAQTTIQKNTAKPWTYWWWMGSAVNEKDITYQLENFAKVGVGGVHIIPIYGVKGYESQFIPYLSERWMKVLSHTVHEGKRLGVGVDMTTGTGWPFGGPNVTPDIAAKKWQMSDKQLVTILTKQAVKRAAPQGEGLVLDPFSAQAMPKYVQRFDSAFAKITARPRAMYNDSYEVYGANWTADFLTEFQKRRGYDLESQLATFLDTTNARQSVLIKIDYHQTLSELLRENYAKTWTDWSRKNGFLTRYQAHGSPGNLLDLYELADIPETESFGSSRFPITGLRVDENYEVDRYGTPNPLAMKFASSVANFSGKKLVSSETTTWLANHFKVSLSQIKPQIDELFTAGINHIFYHGTTYSPQSEPFPGWLFYASTNYGLHSHFSKHFSLLNTYVERCQTRLQNSQPDNDILVYFPIHDLWARPTKLGGIHQLEVHHVDKWLLQLPFGTLCEDLWNKGFSFDYASDDQLNRLTVNAKGEVSSTSATYRVIIVPSCSFMPESTLKQLVILAKNGAKILFVNQLPTQVAGFYQQQERQIKFEEIRQSLEKSVTKDLQTSLETLNIRQETWTQNGLRFIRKRQQNKTIYFVANQDKQFEKGWITLSTPAKSIEKYDPLTAKTEVLPTRIIAQKTQVYLSLSSGESCFLLLNSGQISLVQLPQVFSSFALESDWQIKFLAGKPNLPKPALLTKLVSWTTLSDSASYFSGTARYSKTFDLPQDFSMQKNVILDLGDVREVAEVKLNGQKIGTAWCLPFRLTIPTNVLKAKGNRLEIDVTNLSVNYMRMRDRQQPEWKKFYEINFVDIQYKPFDASAWNPMPSGLLSEVKLLYTTQK